MDPQAVLRLHFINQGTSLYVDLQSTEGKQVTRETVTIGGHTYSILGAEKAVTVAHQHLLSLDLTSVKNYEELQLGVHKIFGPKSALSFLLYKTHAIGLSKLMTSSFSHLPLDEIEAYLRKLDRHPFFSGYLIVTSGDRILIDKEFIPKGIKQTAPISKAIPFNIMSVGKLFTAIAIMQLCEKKTLHLDFPIQQILTPHDIALDQADAIYLQDLHGWNGSEPQHLDEFLKNPTITIRHLLTHTAGLIKEKIEVPQRYDSTRVGERHYSNYGYQLLARIVKNASKEESFVAYVKKNIFEKAKMTGAIECLEKGIQSEPQPFNTSLGEMIPVDVKKEQHYQVPGPDGNGCWWMTANDLLLFSVALAKNVLISSETKKSMVTPQIQSSPTSYQGLGFWIENTHPLIFAHPGGFTGRSAALVMTEGSTPLTVVCLSNTNQGANVAGEIIQLMRGEKVITPLLNDEIKKNRKLYDTLRILDAKALSRIGRIIQESEAPPFVIEAIAQKIELSGNLPLAQSIRKSIL